MIAAPADSQIELADCDLFNVCFAPDSLNKVKVALLPGPAMSGKRAGAFASPSTHTA
jgi:hypothetical protein